MTYFRTLPPRAKVCTACTACRFASFVRFPHLKPHLLLNTGVVQVDHHPPAGEIARANAAPQRATLEEVETKTGTGSKIRARTGGGTGSRARIATEATASQQTKAASVRGKRRTVARKFSIGGLDILKI